MVGDEVHQVLEQLAPALAIFLSGLAALTHAELTVITVTVLQQRIPTQQSWQTVHSGPWAQLRFLAGWADARERMQASMAMVMRACRRIFRHRACSALKKCGGCERTAGCRTRRFLRTAFRRMVGP